MQNTLVLFIFLQVPITDIVSQKWHSLVSFWVRVRRTLWLVLTILANTLHKFHHFLK